MSKITVLIGISGSGKSTLAKEMAKSTGAKIVNRDSLRSMIFGLSDSDHTAYYQDPELYKKEKMVTKMEESIIKTALKEGNDVIADNTHLRIKYLNEYQKYNIPVEFLVVDEDLFTCLTRDSQRERSVGRDIIQDQYQRLLELKKNFDFKPFTPVERVKKERDPDKRDCMIFDLDGTLAIMNGRGPFDWHRVHEDGINFPIFEIYQTMSFSKEMMGLDFIIVSGRSEESMKLTKKWLETYAIHYDGIYMRKKGDYRKDSIVKEEIWAEIEKDYNIICMFDDRNQVVDHARSLGHTVLQVAEGDF